MSETCHKLDENKPGTCPSNCRVHGGFKREVLSRYVNDPKFNMQDVQDALDMNSRSGAINAMKNEARQVLFELEWAVDNSLAPPSR